MADEVQGSRAGSGDRPEVRLVTRALEGGLVVVTLPGDLSAPRVALMRAGLSDALDRTVRALIIDLKRTRLVDSAGLSAFVTLHKRAAVEQVAFVLCGASPEVTSLLQLTRLDLIVPVLVDVEAAVHAARSGVLHEHLRDPELRPW